MALAGATVHNNSGWFSSDSELFVQSAPDIVLELRAADPGERDAWVRLLLLAPLQAAFDKALAEVLAVNVVFLFSFI